MPTSNGKALADEYGIKFFETVSISYMLPKLDLHSFICASLLIPKVHVLQSAKTNLNVEEVFFSIARDIKQRLAETDTKAEVLFFFFLLVFSLFL